MMCLLPLQWGWAAAASVCEHESSGAAHFGHHDHEHLGEAGDDSQGGPAAEHPDCQVCHGIGAACLEPFDGGAPLWAAGASLPDYARVLPEPPVESFLRPPLSTLVA